MSTTYETGHAKNVANFEALIYAVINYGGAYNPSVKLLTLTELEALLSRVHQVTDALNTSLANWSNAVALRELAYEPLRKLSSRIMSALKATVAPQQVIDNALTNHRKLTGVRASAKLSEEEIDALSAEGKEVKQISASQQSFDSMLDTFDKQVKLLATITQYAPNETELKTATLQTLFTSLQSNNMAVLNAQHALDMARIARNKELYDEEVGIKAIAIDVKNYVKSLFGLGSPQYKQIASLGFGALRP